MKRQGKAWSLFVFSSANAIRKYEMRQLVELGVSWVWIGLESAQAGYSKLMGTDTVALTRELQAHGIRVQGSTIIGMDHHTPQNISQEIDYAVSHDADCHQFMLYTPVPGTPLHADMQAQGRMLDDVDLADIHGQFKFNFRHEHIERDDSKVWLDWAFQRDFDVNGPSLFRMMRTAFEGWKRYQDDSDARVRERFAAEAGKLRHGYGAALWAMEKYYRHSNSRVSERVSSLRQQIERELGGLSRAIDHVLGPILLWSARRDARAYPAGRALEPRTFVDRRNWASLRG